MFQSCFRFVRSLLIVAMSMLLWAQATAEETFDPSPFGIMGFPYSHAKVDPQVFDKAEAHMQAYLLSGARWDRRDFWWGIVQPERDRWEWEYFDRAIDDFRRHGVHVVVILCYGSAWKGHAPSSDEEIGAFGEYAYRMVDRYKDWVKHWEVWNEPNILPFWAPKANVADYTRLLQSTYRRIKEADPEAVVIGGAFAGADGEFLRRMYENGARGSFDALSYHTYGNDPTPESQLAEIELLRSIMEENDDLKPLWLTETGIYTGPAGVSEQLQAERLVKSSVRWRALGLERMFQLTLKDWTDDPDAVDATSYRGILHASGTPKPSFHAHRTMADVLGGARHVGSPRFHPQVESHLFHNGSVMVLALWADEEASVDLEIPTGSATALRHGMTGARELVITPQGRTTLTIGQEPIYLEGTGDTMTFAAGWSVETEPSPLAAGEQGIVRFVYRDKLGEVTDLVVDNVSMEDESAEAGDVYRDVNSGVYTMLLTVPEAAGRESLLLNYRVSGSHPRGAVGPATLFADVPVAPPVSIAFRPLQRITLPMGALELDINNHSSHIRSGHLEVEWTEGLRGLPSQRVELQAGAVSTLPVLFDVQQLRPDIIYTATASFSDESGTATAEFDLKPLMVPRRNFDVTIDGDLSEWEDRMPAITPEMLTEVTFNPALLGGPDALSARGWLAWDDDSLYFALEVRDNAIHLPTDTVVWNFDSLQLAIDALNDALPGAGYDRNDFEMQVAKLRDGTNLIYAGRYPDGFIDAVVPEESELAIQVDEAARMIRYEMRLPASILPGLVLEEGRVFGFNFIHNDNDTGGAQDRRGWIELTPGIGFGKAPAEFRDAILLP